MFRFRDEGQKMTISSLEVIRRCCPQQHVLRGRTRWNFSSFCPSEWHPRGHFISFFLREGSQEGILPCFVLWKDTLLCLVHWKSPQSALNRLLSTGAASWGHFVSYFFPFFKLKGSKEGPLITLCPLREAFSRYCSYTEHSQITAL